MGNVFKRTTKLPDGTEKKSSRYYIAWKDASGRRRQKAAYVDKAASLQVLAQYEKGAALEQAGLTNPFEEHSQARLSEHLKDFATHLRDRGVSARYMQQHKKQLELAFKEMGAKYPPDLSAEKAERFLLWLVEKKKYSRKTRNTYFASLRQFARWGVQRKRWATDPFESITNLRIDH